MITMLQNPLREAPAHQADLRHGLLEAEERGWKEHIASYELVALSLPQFLTLEPLSSIA